MTAKLLRLIAASLLLSIALPSWAQDEKNGAEDKKEEEKPKSIAELTKDSEAFEGLFTLYRDTKTGKTHLLISEDQLGKEYIYWMQVANGVLDAGYFKGAYGPSGIIELRRNFNTVEIWKKNTNFWFDPDNPLSRASSANITDALVAVLEISGEDKDGGRVLTDADKLFASEALVQVTPSPNPNPEAAKEPSFSLGKLDEKKTRILNLRSYPQNTDVEVEYVFNNPTPVVQGSQAVTDSRYISVRMMHSFIEVPKNDFVPRRDDPRVGFFSGQVTDLTSNAAAPFRDHVNRWHLVKKDPSAAMSEPVEPITWWIENTTPLEWRDLIRDAALDWNRSFEKIGFKDAIVVKVQPDDADWDAGDIRYNVLRWTSSPNPPFGGYGPSFTNPRTGQIIGADIMLEYSFMGRFLRSRGKLQDPTAGQDLALWSAFEPEMGGHYCSLGAGLQANTMFARAAADSLYGLDDELDQRLVHDTMHYLILHEMGHTLGMNHNMKATQLLTPDEAFSTDNLADGLLAGSIMDYPAVNFAPTREQQGLYYSVVPGPYDDWFVEYGYSQALDDPAAEEQRLEAILARSTEPQLAFGNDADDMRSPGAGIDPRVNIYDMSSDSIGYASQQMTLFQDALDRLPENYPAQGKSYQETVEAVTVMLALWGRSAAVTSRWIGGVYVDRAMVGQPGASAPFRPVSRARQQNAMQVLAEQVFAPGAIHISPELLQHTAPRRRGFNHFGQTEDPKIHDAVLNIQKGVLDHLLNPVVMKRITDSGAYGNTYSLADMMGDLTGAIFNADARGDIDSFRQNLQVEYVQRLAKMARGNGGQHTATSAAVFELEQVADLLDGRRGGDRSTQAHVAHLEMIIDRALSADV
ncbi:DUF5117 domain-containing protein [Marinihelvus fidelis]|uniref:DUF5117 domain-containing protein n=1 Tax=Marinihelvus fidelis TaxID=2613842 RepID=A0A5N0TG53_9GAMM|nr:zinc-dependent metalloprotease [Marinihelvus fidelis]KAA9134143.1 DUF5117 domain-containing protein [Marinihelvus fidelis]